MSDKAQQKRDARIRRHRRVRKQVRGTATRPRMAVYRSNRHINAQIIDDISGRTIAAASSVETGVASGGTSNIAAATAVVSRAGSATVSELSALGVPAVYVPYPVGNGEQRFNAAGVVQAGGGVLVEDKNFTASWVKQTLLPLLRDEAALEKMSSAARKVGMRDGTARMMNLIDAALSSA